MKIKEFFKKHIVFVFALVLLAGFGIGALMDNPATLLLLIMARLGILVPCILRSGRIIPASVRYAAWS